MKKLMFATALAASVVAFAEGPINATSFEGYTADAAVVGAGGGDVGESGVGANYFYYQGDTDGSLVKAFGSGDIAAPSKTRPLYFAEANPNANYLELSTEGGILWRSINTLNSETVDQTTTYSLGNAEPIAADGTYLDTLVQFTPTEDGGAPEVTQDDKLAIWLNVDGNGVTNLMVKAGWVDSEGVLGATNFVLSGKAVVAGEWYRLTIKALPDILVANEELKYPAFMIYIDHTEMSAGCSTIDSDFVNESLGELFLDGMASKVSSGSVFVSLVAGEVGTDATLQGVGFKGSGALDDLVWTTEDPFAGGGSTWVDNVTNVFAGASLSAGQKSAITSWATANNIVVAAGQEEIAAAAYLLGQTSLPAAEPELTITSIEEGADAWTLTVAATVNDTALVLPSTIPGTITLTQAATLAGLGTATPATTGFTATVSGTVTVTIAKDATAPAKFMKVGVALVPAN